MKILLNQPIAEEGKLPYPQPDGNIIWKYKDWDNLKTFIGVKVPIVDDHPEDEEGNIDFVSSQTRVWGYANIKQCPLTKKLLCADLELDDDAPERKGYSIGYAYKEGKIPDGITADIKQDIGKIDHLALTNLNRSPIAMKREVKVAGDTTNNTEVNIYYIGVDSYKFQPNVEYLSTSESENTMPTEAELKAAIKERDSYFAELSELRKGNTADLQKKLKDTQTELQKTKTNFDSEKESKEKIKKERDSLRKEKEDVMIKEMDSKMATLVKVGIEGDALKGKSYDYILGRYDQLGFDAKRFSSVGIKDLEDDSDKGGDSAKLVPRSSNDFKWDGEKFVVDIK